MSCWRSDYTNLKLRRTIQKILQDFNKCYKNSKKYYDELTSKSKNKAKTTRKIIKNEK